ncbi:restriction endonuclease subunit S [Bacillus mycoides]|uniref:restriction endonuclease subunit S n=1 Tax=Bacillus mycoides TaxID=1405 RepID=UPI001C0361D9|nr:restriction endonuclease subunit S [Bacillus mycoides]QWG36722.1 hypothetical protein EXW30_28425 [Bacillus mycoides]
MKKKNYSSNKWPSFPLGEISTLGKKSSVTKMLPKQLLGLNRVTHRDLSSDSYILNQKQSQKENFITGDRVYGEGTILVSLDRMHRGIGLLMTEAVVASGICGIKIKSVKILPEYLLYYLLWIRKYLPKQKPWTISYLRNLMIPVPPIQIQQHIVTVLSKINEINEKRRKAIMLIDNYVTALYFSQFNVVKNSESFWKGELKEIIEEIELGSSFRNNKNLHSIPILKGYPDLSQFEVWEENREIDETFIKNIPLARFGDILWNIKSDRDSKENLVIVHTWSYPIAFSDEWVRIKPLANISSEYLAAFLRLEYPRISLMCRTHRQKDLSKKLSELQIYIPTQINQILFTSMVRKVNNISKIHHQSLLASELLNSVLNDRFFQ